MSRRSKPPSTEPARPRGARAITTLLLLLASSAVVAQSEAVGTPYLVLYQALAPAVAAREFDRLHAIEAIESKLPNVAPGSIRITLKTRAGDVNVPVAADGRVSFPLTDALLAENPLVLTNQPKGSLTLSVTLALRLPRGSRVAVDELGLALDQVDHLLRAQEGAARRVRGVEFRFGAADASLTLRGRSERLLMADADGRIVVMRDGDLGAAREIDFAHPPLLALPYLGH